MSIELVYDRVDGELPKRTVVFLHGILGRGNNLRAIAKRFVQAQSGWSAWLVDMRGHGRSPKRSPNPSLTNAAADVVNLAMSANLPLEAIVGHSFGGKVALEAARTSAMPSLEHVVVIDSVPGSREPFREDDSALALIETIESLPRTFSSRSEFIEALVAAGKPPILAQWLAQSLEQEGDRLRYALSLDEIRSLILDYFATDLWSVVERPPGAVRIHLVIGDRSDSYSPADRRRAERISASDERVTVDVLPAGHWVHVDDPEGLLQTLLKRMG